MDKNGSTLKFYGTFAAAGVATRALQLGILKRNFGHYKMGYVYSAALFLGFGAISKAAESKAQDLLDRKLSAHKALESSLNTEN